MSARWLIALIMLFTVNLRPAQAADGIGVGFIMGQYTPNICTDCLVTGTTQAFPTTLLVYGGQALFYKKAGFAAARILFGDTNNVSTSTTNGFTHRYSFNEISFGGGANFALGPVDFDLPNVQFAIGKGSYSSNTSSAQQLIEYFYTTLEGSVEIGYLLSSSMKISLGYLYTVPSVMQTATVTNIVGISSSTTDEVQTNVAGAIGGTFMYVQLLVGDF